MRWSNWALLVYGYGKSFTKYLAAFLSRFSEIITWDLLKSARDFGSIPATFLTNRALGGRGLVPAPPHDP